MKHKILFVERKPSEFVSIENAFRRIAANLPDDFETGFQQVPYGNRFTDTLLNLLLFRKKTADIYHITGHVHYLALLFAPRNTVLSIMDVRFLYIKPVLRRWLLRKLYLEWPVKRLAFITAISEQTKAEIVKQTGCDESKIRVFDLPLSFSDLPTPSEPAHGPKPIILQIGTMENKNISNLAKALKGLDCRLRVIGQIRPDDLASLQENAIDFENAFNLSDDEIIDEYRQADIVSFCSTYEGFGLPIIEAQAMRRPVLTSNISPMKETAGGAGCLCDPFDVSSIREGVQTLISDRAYRQKLIEDGIENVRRFDPAAVAAQYARLYKEMLRKD